MAKLSRDGFPGLIPLAGSDNLYIQIGKGAFDGVYTDTTDVPIRTQLTSVTAMFAQVSDTYSPATDATMTEYGLFCDVAVSSNTVSVYRSSQGAVSGLPFNYFIIGTVDVAAS